MDERETVKMINDTVYEVDSFCDISLESNSTEMLGSSEVTLDEANAIEEQYIEYDLDAEEGLVGNKTYPLIKLVENQIERFKQQEAEYEEALRKIKRRCVTSTNTVI